MTTYYVSNNSSNGYALGVDTNNGTSQSTPFLTIAHAISIMASTGDTCIVNPSSNSATAANNPYVENSGSGYLDFGGKKNNYMADPNFTSTGFLVVQSTATSRVANTQGDTSATMQTITDFVFDCQNVSAKPAFTPHQSGNSTFTRLRPVNVAANATAVTLNCGAQVGNYIIDRYIVDATALGGAIGYLNSTTASTLQIQGGAFTMPSLGANGTPFIAFGNPSSTVGALILTTDVNGGRPQFTGNAQPIKLSGSIVSIAANNFDTTNTPGMIVCNSIDTTLTVTGSITINNFTYTYGANTTRGVYYGPNELVVCPTIHDGVLSNTGTTINVDPIAITNGNGSAIVYNNTVTSNGSQHCIAIGTDGYATDVQNIATTTGNQNLGDVSGNTYVDQFCTTTAISSAHCSYLGSYIVNMAKSGSPTGTISCSAYLDNAGVPGTLIETSDTTLSAASLTGSALPYQFDFANHTYVAPSTKIHLVLSYTGTIDGTNYVTIQSNATVTAGSTLVSANGSSWTAQTSKALLFALCTGPYGITDSVIRNNITYATSNALETHMNVMFCITRGQIYRNQIYGGSIGYLMKLIKGSSTNRSLTYDNLFYSTQAEGGAAFYAKATNHSSCYNNIFVIDTTYTGNAVLCAPDSQSFNSVTVTNQQQCNDIVVENNILINSTTLANNVNTYALNSNGLGAAPTNIVINYNDVWNPGGQRIGTSGATWTLWQGAGYDLNSVNANPLLPGEISGFTTPANFVPSNSSPAKGIGTNTNGVVTTDYAGNPFFVTPDAGAYSISYNAQQAALGNKLVYNPFTSNFDYVSLTGANAVTLFEAAPQIVPSSSSMTISPQANLNIIILANAASGNLTYTLPVNAGNQYIVKKIDSSANTVTIAPASGQIQGAGALTSSVVITSQGTSITSLANGTNLYVV